jgi:hypothetical protein
MLGRRSKGLTRNVTCKSAPEGFDGRLVAELWVYPDGSRILKLSTKCAPSEAFQRAAEARPFLMGRGVDLAGDQETKTRTALEFFSGNLEAAAAGLVTRTALRLVSNESIPIRFGPSAR